MKKFKIFYESGEVHSNCIAGGMVKHYSPTSGIAARGGIKDFRMGQVSGMEISSSQVSTSKHLHSLLTNVNSNHIKVKVREMILLLSILNNGN